MRNSLAARTWISTPRAGASLTKASIELTTPLICGSQASVTMRMRVGGSAGPGCVMHGSTNLPPGPLTTTTNINR